MHLRSLNSHVETALREWQVHHDIMGAMPRQQAPLQVEYSKHVVGTSSFGMSGINAHMLVRAASTTKTQVTSRTKSSLQQAVLLHMIHVKCEYVIERLN